MICTGCNEDKPIKARGLCGACYTQWQKTGSTVRVRTRGLKGKPCIVEGCDGVAHGRGLCHKHLKRERLTGSLDDPRANQPTPLTLHPLYPQWIDFQRARNPRPVVPEWKADFETFLAGVGDRPSKRHRLYRRDKTLPMGPANFEWRIALLEKEPGEDQLTYNRRYRRAHREMYGTDYHMADLMRKYGLTTYDLAAMAEKQGHRCAICGNPEIEQRNGLVKHLAVDHDHRPGGKVRELLCQACNKGLGCFKDDFDVMLKAIEYLHKHDALYVPPRA